MCTHFIWKCRNPCDLLVQPLRYLVPPPAHTYIPPALQVTALLSKHNEQSEELEAVRSDRNSLRLQLVRGDDRGTRLVLQLASLEQENSAQSAKLLAANNERAQLQSKLESMQVPQYGPSLIGTFCLIHITCFIPPAVSRP